MAASLDETTVVDAASLTVFATELLSSEGVKRADAELIATSLVDADLRGIHSHGVSRIGIYLERLRAGGNRAHGAVTVVAEAPGLVLLDAGHVLSQVASAQAIDIAMARAAENGCAAVSVRAGSHFGAAGYWARLIAQAGMLGVASTNGSPLMVPWGSAISAIGTNPLAMAFPSSGPHPVVVDLATSEATWGAVLGARAAGKPIPTTWALDDNGEPTDDAEKAVEARRLMPFGRHKGSALAVGVELLTGALAGARFLSAVSDMYARPGEPLEFGHFFLALDPASLGPDGAGFADAVHAVQREINELPAAPGVERVMWPGQPEAERAAQRLALGIPLPRTIVDELVALGRVAGVDSALSAD